MIYAPIVKYRNTSAVSGIATIVFNYPPRLSGRPGCKLVLIPALMSTVADTDSFTDSSSSSSHFPMPTRTLPPAPLDIDAAAQVHANGDAHVVSSPTEDDDYKDDLDQKATELTPLRAHYLKKSLISSQIHRELDGISTGSPIPNVSTLSYLGPPFNLPPKEAPPLDLPFLKYIFRQFILTFPFLSTAPKDFFPEKLQPFIASVLSRNFTTVDFLKEDSDKIEEETRRKILSKVEKQFSLMFGSATKLVEREEIVRLTQADLNRLETLAKKRRARQSKREDVFEVNIVCIRAVVDKGRMRSKVHEVGVFSFYAQRYGDFRSLAEELRKRYPDEEVPSPPAKDKSTVSAAASAPATVAASPTASMMPGSFNRQLNDSQESVLSFNAQQAVQNIRLAREKNRLTLRAYLHTLLNNSVLGSSPVLLHFLTSDPTTLSRDELDDACRREDSDRKRDEGRIRFAHEITARVEGLRNAIKSVKGDIMQKDGLSHVFAIIRATENVRNLPQEFQAAFEWGRISLASILFQRFVAADDASESFATLKRLHGLMPYLILRGILKISNPVAMVRGVLDLFLAQPFGGRSLLQRMFASSFQESVKALEEDIEAVKDKIEDDVMCEKIRQFVYAPREIQNIYKSDASTEGVNLLTVVLRSGEAPYLTRPQLYRVMRAHRAHAEYMRQRSELADSDDDDGPQDDDAWLYEDLMILAKLYSHLRDKEEIIDLIFESTTSNFFKDIITIFYSPLAQVYKAASIGDSLSDLQTFIDDLIRTVEAVEEASQDNPNLVVQTFIDLVGRHEQSFYSFVHKVHSKGEGLFDSLMKWIQLFISVFRDGFGEKISLEFLLPYSGPERVALMKEVDEVAVYHYKLKLAHEEKLRRRFGRAQGQSEADAEDEFAQQLVDGVVHDLSFGELVRGDVEEMGAAMSDVDNSSDDSDDSDDFDEEDETSSEETTTESESTPEDAPPVPPPKPISRSSTYDHSPQSESYSHQLVQPRPDTLSPHHSHHSSYPQDQRGRVSEQGSPVRKVRSRSSIGSLKSMFSRSGPNPDAPPVPPLPSYLPQSLQPKPLPPSPLSAGTPGQPARRRTPPLRVRKRKGAMVLQPPELTEIPKLLPLFIEIMKPQLRPMSL
ncbi:hypothetical protein A7U60_g8040 [Sanghuangporus baumii]|uniref:PX domain-containing protein n=1 Tax=Sanghuangporus baumii TaxID=108892 RepID=A0A9Q5HRU6_SANBA|nr:hypothetical protein A7U60_g8040 [Sanghuangporus baumii]